jgi:uncharacterized protein Veg
VRSHRERERERERLGMRNETNKRVYIINVVRDAQKPKKVKYGDSEGRNGCFLESR